MTDPILPGAEVPDELAALDAELSSIRYEERPSFGPELEAELARRWAALPAEEARETSRRGWLAAAVVAGLLLTSLVAPSARAAIIRWVGTLQTGPQEPVAEVSSLPEPAAPVSAAAPAAEPAAEEPVADPLPEPPSEFATEAAPATLPELVDREGTETLLRRHYPERLQSAGVGGTVRLRMWVGSTGAPDRATVAASSGIDGLDRAALAAAPWFRFLPARRGSQATGSWVEFDVHFEPDPALRFPVEIEPVAAAPLLLSRGAYAPSPSAVEAGELIRAALGDEGLIARLGPVSSILEGDPPPGAAPTQWRVDVTRALTDAAEEHPGNPAPLLALGRIRLKQGLRTDARLLFERGLERALRSPDAVGPRLLADLHYERGSLVKASWLNSWRLGRLPAEAMRSSLCPGARSSGGAASGYASVERLVAWNYLCPTELHGVLERHFETVDEGAADLAVMMASFQRAVEAFPAHVEANVEILLARADEGRWEEVLTGARRFGRATGGHPAASLIAGLALQRLGRAEEALAELEPALGELPSEQSAALRSVAPLLDARRGAEYEALSEAGRRAFEEEFWATLDPIASTEVNEREVEHLVRAAYAALRFGGLRSDAGSVWVRYGRPDHVRAVGWGTDLRVELWDYGATGPDLTFSRPTSSTVLDLTAEGRAYVDELSEVYPHRYGTEARTVVPLQGDVTRAVGGTDGSVHIRVRSQVPEVFATGGSAQLRLGVFLVKANGGTVELSRASLAAVAGAPIDVTAVAAASASALLVEVYDPATGRTASLVAGVRGSVEGAAPLPLAP